MTPTILFRIGARLSEADECRAALRHLPVVTSRVVCRDALVFGRYSVLPFYEDLAADLGYLGSRLVNSYDQHRWIADFGYYAELRDFTFRSWTEDEFPRSDHPGPFVVKGATNSKKHHWDTLMFARDRRAAVEVAGRLREDELVGRQRLVFREYVPLVTYEVGLNGLAFTNEHRLFFLGETLLAHGYYWTEAEVVDRPLAPEGLAFAREVAAIVARHAHFFVLDVAEKATGGWILVEVNDAQQAGLSMCDPDELYRNLARAARAFNPE